jgi:hypothetical protein
MACRGIQTLGLAELSSVRRLREAGVKGMKWGQRKGKQGGGISVEKLGKMHPDDALGKLGFKISYPKGTEDDEGDARYFTSPKAPGLIVGYSQDDDVWHLSKGKIDNVVKDGDWRDFKPLYSALMGKR